MIHSHGQQPNNGVRVLHNTQELQTFACTSCKQLALHFMKHARRKQQQPHAQTGWQWAICSHVWHRKIALQTWKSRSKAAESPEPMSVHEQTRTRRTCRITSKRRDESVHCTSDEGANTKRLRSNDSRKQCKLINITHQSPH